NACQAASACRSLLMTCSGVCHFRMIVSWPREVHNGGWDHVSPNDDCNLYALRFTFWHAGQAGDREAEARLGKDPSFVRACNDFGVAASTARHHSLAMELFDLAVWVGRQQARVGATDRSLALDAALSNQGILLLDLGQFSEAVKVLDEAEKLFRDLARAGRYSDLQPGHGQAMGRVL